MPSILPITIPAQLVADYAEATRLRADATAKYRTAEKAQAEAYQAWCDSGRVSGTYDEKVRPFKRVEVECSRVADDAFARLSQAQGAIMAAVDAAIAPLAKK